MINKQIVSIKYITVFQYTYYILHCFLYPFILLFFLTLNQWVEGSSPSGVTSVALGGAFFVSKVWKTKKEKRPPRSRWPLLSSVNRVQVLR